ncbi:MAG TPA: C25 family cysteine peptidase [Myxococcaceae bacterium]|nr:C25 family cysteine peptidase [Myxococcaceae bacterium]
MPATRWIHLTFVAAMLASPSALAVARTFRFNSGAWNTANNWNPVPRTVPTAADTATISRAVAGTITVAGTNASVLGLIFGGTATSTVSCTGTTMTVGASGLTMTGAATANQVIACPTTLSGTVALNGTGVGVTISGAVTATTLTTTGVGSLTLSGGGNAGALTVSSTGTLTLGANLNATSLSVPSGGAVGVNFSAATTVSALTVSGNATLAGSINVTKSGGVTITPGSYAIVTSTGGTLNTTGISIGGTPSGNGFGLRQSGNTLFLDVFVQAVQVDTVASTTGTCASSLTWQHTVGANTFDRYLVVGISTGFAGATTGPSAVTYGSQTMSQLGADNAGTTRVFLFGLVAPARGTNTITVTWNAGSCFAVAGSVSYTGVNQATPVGTAVVGVDTPAGTATVNVTTVQGDKVFSVLSSNNSATSATPVQTSAIVRWNTLNSTELGAADTFNVTSPGTTTISWNLTPATANLWSLVAIPIHAANPTRASTGTPELRLAGGAAAVSWKLEPGSDVVGFRVWRDSAGLRQLLTPDLVAGPVLTSRATLLAGSDVGWVDVRPIAGAQYWVESLHLDGTTELRRATPAAGKAPAFASAVVGQPPSLLRDDATPRISAADPPLLRRVPVLRELQWQLAEERTVKLVVSRTGMVRVPAEALFASGVPVGTSISSIELFREARQVPRTVLAANGATLQPGDAVEFYGRGMETRYSGAAVYWLRAGRGVGREIPVSGASPVEAGTTSSLAAAEIRERLVWFGALRNGDAEKFFGPAVYSQARQRTLTLEGLDVSARGARLQVALQGVTQVPHEVSLTLNGLPVGTVRYDGQTLGTASVDLPPGALVPGDNVVGLVAPGASDVSLEQYVRIVYPRYSARGSGALELTLAGGSATRLDGFDPALTRVLDITDPDLPVRLITWEAGGTAAVMAAGSGNRRLLAFLPEDAIAPDSVSANQPSSWHSAEGADLVVIGPSALFPGLQPLVDRRRAEGLGVALVDIEDVQDEFASGEKSAEAIRGFLSQALRNWSIQPRWVMLLGSATYDPRNYLGLGGDLVPSGIVQTDALEAASDSWFLALPEADAVSIGRLPVRTLAETGAVVTKILGRRTADARSPVLLVSDARGTSDFPEMTADLRADLPEASATVLIRGSQPDDALHQQLLDAARAGPALVNYTGHANETFWSGNLLTVDDASALAGGGTSLWIHMTCMTAFFQDPHRQSLVVATLVTPGGGAWGSWGSTAMTYPSEHPMLDRALVRALLVDGMTLGEATRAALSGTSDADLQSTFVLLGDPSARAVSTHSAGLQISPRSGALGCSSPGSGLSSLALLGLVATWIAAARRRSRVTARR